LLVNRSFRDQHIDALYQCSPSSKPFDRWRCEARRAPRSNLAFRICERHPATPSKGSRAIDTDSAASGASISGVSALCGGGGAELVEIVSEH
jgi:hypothetical protein